MFASQRGFVPVFIEQRSNTWYCMSNSRCSRLADDAETIALHSTGTMRDDVSMVLFLERDKR